MQQLPDWVSSELLKSVRGFVIALVVSATVNYATRRTRALVEMLVPRLISYALKRIEGTRPSGTIHNVTEDADTSQRFIVPDNFIAWLPDEIWCHIWSLLDFSDRLVVTGVCQAWRTLAIETPQVWRGIRFVTNRHGQLCICADRTRFSRQFRRHSNIGTLSLAFRRGQQTNIDLVIDARTVIEQNTDHSDHLDRNNLEALTDLLVEHCSRVVSITLETDEPKYFDLLLRLWGKDMVFPNLHTFRLNHVIAQSYLHPFDFPPVGGDRLFRSPHLRYYEASSGVFDWPRHFTEHQTRHITDLAVGTRAPWIDIPSILKSCPRLQRARVFATHVQMANITPFDSPAELPTLQRFILDDVTAILEPRSLSNIAPDFNTLWDAFLLPPAEAIHVNYATIDARIPIPCRGLALFSRLASEDEIVLAITNPYRGRLCISAKPVSSAGEYFAADGALLGATRVVTCNITSSVAELLLSALAEHLNLSATGAVHIRLGRDSDWFVFELARHMPLLPATTTLDISVDGSISLKNLKMIAVETMWDDRLPALEKLILRIPTALYECRNWTSADGSRK